VDLTEHQRRAVKARWKKATQAEKSAAASHASRAYWDALTPGERSAEMFRRAKKRKRNPKG